MDITNMLNLKSLMNSDEYVDNTEKIRELKHSESILADIGKICELKQAFFTMKQTEPNNFYTMCSTNCPFLFSHYTDIFNKVVADEIDLKMFVEFIKVLKRIEENDIDQFQGSVIVGQILHDIYIDSAKRKGAKYDEISVQEKEKEEAEYVKPVKLSWKDYKQQRKQQ